MKSDPSRFYNPALDGLRFFAFLAVFAHHSLPNKSAHWLQLGLPERVAELAASVVVAGAYGVDLFFALSAYLITELLLREHDRYGRIDYKRFYFRRCLRIWPLYYCFILFAVTLGPVLFTQEVLGVRQLLSFLFFVGNYECALFGYPSSVIAPLWSVAIEEQFYLLWPLALRGFGAAHHRRALFLLLVAALTTRAYLVFDAAEHPRIWCDGLARFDPFIAGAVVALLLRRSPPPPGGISSRDGWWPFVSRVWSASTGSFR